MEAKKTKHGGAGAGVSLPEEIIFDVLSWLPLRSLCRFRCVSKAWRALITDPSLAALQRSRAGAPLLAGVFAAAAEGRRELRVMDTDGNVVRVVKDVEGTAVPTRLDLVCLNGGTDLSARVIDPATGRGVTVGGQGGLYKHSFGRALSGSYKVVRCHCSGLLEITTLAATGGGSGEPIWRQLPAAQPAVRVHPYYGCTAAVNGALHFLTVHQTSLSRRSRVAHLDLDTEQWKTTIEAPATNSERQEVTRWETTIGELKGTLSLVETIWSKLVGTFTEIWLLADPEKSIWIKEYVIPMPITVSLVEPLEVLADGTILLLNTFEEEGRSKKTRALQLYDPSIMVCKDLMKWDEDQFSGKMALYTGSLLSSSTTLENSC